MSSMTHRISIRGVYYLESQNANMNPIAIRIQTTPPDYIAWEDTGHGRILRNSKVLFDGKEINANTPAEIDLDHIPETIEVTSQTGEVYQFVKLTLKLFNEKLKPYVAAGGSLNFKNDRELQEYYLTTDFYGIG